MKRLLAVTLSLILSFAFVGAATNGLNLVSAQSTGVQFIETFDSPESMDRFDFGVHHAWKAQATYPSWPGDHDSHCGAPTTFRQVNNPTRVGPTWYPGMGPNVGVVYWCGPPTVGDAHIMTAFNTAHYAQVNFAVKDVLTDVSEVCWDQNRTNLGSRTWTQLGIVPLDTFTANSGRLDYVSARFSPTGPGKYGIHPTDETVLVEFTNGAPKLQIGQAVQSASYPKWNAGSDRATRYTFCVTETATGITVKLETPTSFNVYNFGGRFPDGQVRVILQHDLYNPTKATDQTPNAFTWHWDNVVVK